MDVTTPGSPQVVAQRTMSAHTVLSGTSLAVLQDQDSVRKYPVKASNRQTVETHSLMSLLHAVGNFDLSQTSMGTIGWFNMWDYEMTPDEIAELSTSQQGNIVNWSTLQVQGSPTFTTLDVPVNPSESKLFLISSCLEAAMFSDFTYSLFLLQTLAPDRKVGI